ncbi:MAG: FixH family protein [Thermodesulfovibrionales bacterium]
MKTLVIIVTIIGLSVVIGSIIVGRMVFEGKVVDKPYETGLMYDEMEKAKEKLRFELLKNDFHTGENEIIFTLKDNLDGPITYPQLTLTITRPSTGAFDREYQANLIESGKYRAKVNIPFYGYWDIRLSIIWKQKPVILEKRIYVKP